MKITDPQVGDKFLVEAEITRVTAGGTIIFTLQDSESENGLFIHAFKRMDVISYTPKPVELAVGQVWRLKDTQHERTIVFVDDRSVLFETRGGFRYATTPNEFKEKCTFVR